MRCEAVKQDGTRCLREAPPGKTNALCWCHDPANSEAIKRNTSKAGRARTAQLGESPLSKELTQVRRELYELVDALRSREIAPSIAAVQVQALNCVIRSLSEERKGIIEEETEQRVAELEQRLAA